VRCAHSDSNPCVLDAKGIPTPLPTVGTGARVKVAFVCNAFIAMLSLRSTPDFGRFMARTAAVIGDGSRARQNLPRRSRDKRVPPTDGLHGFKDNTCPLGRVQRVKQIERVLREQVA
jgi:hypothetical protein